MNRWLPCGQAARQRRFMGDADASRAAIVTVKALRECACVCVFLFLGFGSRFQFAFQHCFHFRFTLHLRNVQLCELWPCPCTWAHHASMLFPISVNSFIETKHSKFWRAPPPLNIVALFFSSVCDVNEASPKVCKSPLSV